MKTDPRKACANQEERKFWAMLHDGLAHPFMVATNYSNLSLRFHDYTSHRAWPRPEPFQRVRKCHLGTKFGFVEVYEFAPGFYEFDHPRVQHTYRFNADDMEELTFKVMEHLVKLEPFGGRFAKLRQDEWKGVEL